VAPDLSDNDPAPAYLATPGFNATAWTLLHSPSAVDPILAKAVAYLNSRGIEKIATAGYCYGGRYAFRLLAAGKGVDAGFAAHPSLLENSVRPVPFCAFDGSSQTHECPPPKSMP
jgi:dienelactone hydrolase